MQRLNKLLERFLAWQRSKRIRREVKVAITPDQWAIHPNSLYDDTQYSVTLHSSTPWEVTWTGAEDWPEIIE